MERAQKDLTMAEVAGWGSLLATFGLIQGALYLRAFWGHFGLDPFQFVAVSELALAGLVAIGFVLFLMLVATLFGGWMETKLTNGNSKASVLGKVLAALFFGALGALIWWIDAWPLVFGMALTVGCIVVVQFVPIVPRAIRESPWIAYIAVWVIYVSFASSWFGQERARTIVRGGASYRATLSLEGETQRDLTLIGRLGDSYVLWNLARRSAVLVPVGDVKRLELARKGTSGAPTGE